jgi:hypothetical protein
MTPLCKTLTLILMLLVVLLAAGCAGQPCYQVCDGYCRHPRDAPAADLGHIMTFLIIQCNP